MSIERFEIPYSESAVTDLRARLQRTRWPDQLADAGWRYGAELEFMRELCRYWSDGFDWRAPVAPLGAFDHFRFPDGEAGIHLIHPPRKGPAPQPPVLHPGRPRSFL